MTKSAGFSICARMRESVLRMYFLRAWEPELGEEIGRYLGEEAAAQDVCVLLGPGLNIKRSPFCGRNFEYFSEDPYLAAILPAR